MIRHVWTVPCTMSIVSQGTNNISLLEVLEEVTLAPSESGPVKDRFSIPLIFDVVSMWGREVPDAPEKGLARLQLISPENKVVLDQATEVDLTEFRRLRLLSKVLGLGKPKTGEYQFKISRRASEHDEWEEVGTVPLYVIVEGNSDEGAEDVPIGSEREHESKE